MKLLKLLCITLIASLISCQTGEVKADASLTSANINLTTTANNSSGSSAGCWNTTLQGKCNKQRMLFSKFKVDDQDSLCSLFEVKIDGCHFKADAESKDKLNSLKDETLNKLTDAVNKYVSEKFIKVQAKVLKSQEKNASKVNLSSVDKMSDVTQKSSIVAKKIFENSIRKPFEALGLNPSDLAKVTAEAKVKTAGNIGRMLMEAEIDAIITLPTLDGLVEIQDEIENFDEAEIELEAETDNTLKTILAEQEVQNLMTVKSEVSDISSDKIAKLEINLDGLRDRFVVKSTTTNTNGGNSSINTNTLKNDNKKLEVKANIEAKKLCQDSLSDSLEMCKDDSLCIDIAMAACTKTNRSKIETMTKESSNMSFDEVLQKTKGESSKIADLVKETHVKFSQKTEKLSEFKMAIKNDFAVKKEEESKMMEERFSSEGGKKSFEMNLKDFDVKTNIKINEVKNSLSTNAFLPKDLENLLTKEERDKLIKNTIKDESKMASIMKDSQDFMKGGLDSIEKAFSGLFNNDKLKNETVKAIQDSKDLSSKDKADMIAQIKAGKEFTKDQEKLLEASLKDNKGMMDAMTKSMESAMGAISGLFGGMTSSISNAFGQAKTDLPKSTTDALKNSNDLLKSFSGAQADALKSTTDLLKNSNLINDAIKSSANTANIANIAAGVNTTLKSTTDLLSNLPKIDPTSTLKSTTDLLSNLPKIDPTSTLKSTADLINSTSTNTISTTISNTSLPKVNTDFNVSLNTEIGKRFLQNTSTSVSVNGNVVNVNAEIKNGEIKTSVNVKEDQMKNSSEKSENLEEVKMTLTGANNNQIKTTSENAKSGNSISLENIPYSFTISNLLGCTQEASVLNEFMDSLLGLTVDTNTSAEMSKEILKLFTIIKSFPHPKINRMSPSYEDLLCTRTFSEKSKVKDALVNIEKSESPCFLKINKDGVKTCATTLVEKNKSTENERAKGTEVTIICYMGTCAGLLERGNNVSLYIKGELSFDILTSQRKITSSCLNNTLSLEECCHIAGYTATQKEIAKARLLSDRSVEKSPRICRSEKKEAKANYKALLTINIPTDATEFDQMVKNIFEGANTTTEISVKGRLLTSNEMYVTGTNSEAYSKSNSGLKVENDSTYSVAGSTPSKRASFEESLDTTMTAKAGLQMTEMSSSILKSAILAILLCLLLL